MATNAIPDELRRFVLTSVPSVPYIEAVLLLRREPAAAWTAGSLAERLYVPEAHAAELLQSLREGGVVTQAQGAPNSYHWGPAPPLAAMLEQVARAYSSDLVGVTDLIHSRLDRRAYQFSDAFRFRKDS